MFFCCIIDNHPFGRDGRPNYDGPPSQNRPFQEGYPPGNFDPMGPNPHSRGNLQSLSNFNQGPPHNRPDYYSPNDNNPSYQQHNTRSGGRPSRFSNRQDEYDDDRPLKKPNLSIPDVTTTTAPLYMNQSTNPTYSQARPPMSSTYSSQQPPLSSMFPQGGPTHNPPQSQFGWPNQQQQLGGPGAHMSQSGLPLGSNDPQNPNVSVPPPGSYYGGNNDFHRQQGLQSANQYYSGVPPVPPPNGNKPQNANGNRCFAS